MPFYTDDQLDAAADAEAERAYEFEMSKNTGIKDYFLDCSRGYSEEEVRYVHPHEYYSYDLHGFLDSEY